MIDAEVPAGHGHAELSEESVMRRHRCLDRVCRLRPGVRLEVDLSCLCLNCDFRAYRRVAVGASVCDHPDALPTISRCPQCPPPDAWPLSSRPAP
jgi:hypothetical protein